MTETAAYDFIIIGAGTAGLPAAIFAARRGGRVLLIDAADKIGGTLHLSTGQITAGGTRLQAANGIVDSPEAHFLDVMRITAGLADPVVLGRMTALAPGALHWLMDEGFAPLPGHPVTAGNAFSEGYDARRCCWAEQRGRAVLAVLDRVLQPEIAAGRVTLRLNTRASAILTDPAGAVRGVRIGAGGEAVEISAPQVLIATGGYAMNPALFEKLTGYRPYVGRSYPFSQGDGLVMAEAAGGLLRNSHLHRAGTGSILTGSNFPSTVLGRFNTYPQERPPWEIWVNSQGLRFVAEDEPSLTRREMALLAQPDLRYVVVFDDAIFRDAPPGVEGWTRQQMRDHFDQHPMFVRADTIAELARQAKIDAQGLATAIAAYNAAVANGRDSLGRTHLPRAIATPPYYGIIQYGHANTSSAGIVVDDKLRVLRRDGRPIAGLYAAGEVLGTGALMGRASLPGPLVVAAIAFGKLIGETIPLRPA